MKKEIINKVGIELEGGWNQIPQPINGSIHHDGSVRNINANFLGEVVSIPLDENQISEFINSNYPDKINDTCGMHIHMSFKDGIYREFMTREFFDYFCTELKKWLQQRHVGVRAINRVDGNNRFCKKEYHADAQYRATHKVEERYCIVNYCYNLRGTIEVRVLPMFDSKEFSIMAINRVIFLFKKYYNKNCNRNIINQNREVRFNIYA